MFIPQQLDSPNQIVPLSLAAASTDMAWGVTLPTVFRTPAALLDSEDSNSPSPQSGSRQAQPSTGSAQHASARVGDAGDAEDGADIQSQGSSQLAQQQQQQHSHHHHQLQQDQPNSCESASLAHLVKLSTTAQHASGTEAARGSPTALPRSPLSSPGAITMWSDLERMWQEVDCEYGGSLGGAAVVQRAGHQASGSIPSDVLIAGDVDTSSDEVAGEADDEAAAA